MMLESEVATIPLKDLRGKSADGNTDTEWDIEAERESLPRSCSAISPE